MGWYIISWTVLGKNLIDVFKGKVRVKVQNFISSLSVICIFFIPLISLQSKYVFLCTVSNNQTKYNKVVMY